MSNGDNAIYTFDEHGSPFEVCRVCGERGRVSGFARIPVKRVIPIKTSEVELYDAEGRLVEVKRTYKCIVSVKDERACSACVLAFGAMHAEALDASKLERRKDPRRALDPERAEPKPAPRPSCVTSRSRAEFDAHLRALAGAEIGRVREERRVARELSLAGVAARGWDY